MKLTYDETMKVLKEYGNEIYWFYYDIDPLYAGIEAQAVIKSLKANPIGENNELLDLKAKADYLKGRD